MALAKGSVPVRTISVSCPSCVGRTWRSQRAWMSWSRKGTRLRPTSCQAWSTSTTTRRRGVDTLEMLHDDAPGRISSRREVSLASHGRDGIGTLRAHQTTQTVPRIPLNKVVFPLRERGLVGTCTNSNCLCYNSFTGHGQMLRVVGLALGTGWGVLPYGFLSINPRNSVIWGGSS
jgi:hypothetical protein